MKRSNSVACILLTVLLLQCFLPAFAEGLWYCPKCGRKNYDNFCPADGTARPADLDGAQMQEEEEVYLNELPGLLRFQSCGKLWLHTNGTAAFSHNDNPGYTAKPGVIQDVTDICGNRYQYGLHMDGPDLETYYIEIPLNRNYTTFRCTVACARITSDNTGKRVTFRLDGSYLKSVISSPGTAPREIELNVIGVTTLRIEYEASLGSNDQAVIYDGRLTS